MNREQRRFELRKVRLAKKRVQETDPEFDDTGELKSTIKRKQRERQIKYYNKTRKELAIFQSRNRA